MEAYLDNAATTSVFPEVRDIVVKTMETDYGNPSSKHSKGLEAENHIRQAGEILAATLKCRPQELIFTSGGTEANNLALLGVASANRRGGKHIITTQMEHASVHEPLAYLEEMGYEVTYLPVDSQGHVDAGKLRDAVREDTLLVSVMYVNNEVGAVQDIEGLSRAVKGKNPQTLFHVDAVQAYGKYPIHPRKLGVDLLSVSGHKIHAPKGIGFLYRRENTKLRPVLFGGGQQRGMRSGTENVPAVAGLAEAARIIYEGNQQKIEKLYQLKRHMIEGLLQFEDVAVHAADNIRLTAPHIVSAGFPGVRSEVLLHALAQKGIYVSSGSACSSNRPELSGTLKAIGAADALLDSTLRFSFSVQTTAEEIDYTLGHLAVLLPALRRYTRK